MIFNVEIPDEFINKYKDKFLSERTIRAHWQRFKNTYPELTLKDFVEKWAAHLIIQRIIRKEQADALQTKKDTIQTEFGWDNTFDDIG